MCRRIRCWYFLVCSTVACTASTVQQPGRPTPLPPMPNPVLSPSVAGPWTFSYALGLVSYQISRSATIESRSDSGSHREISTNETHELLTLEPAGDTLRFTVVIDTSSTTTQGAIGSAQSIQLPIQLSGSLIGDRLVISTDSVGTKCEPVSSVLLADLNNLVIRFPTPLSQGTGWRDSVELSACQGMVPTTANITRSYIVSGETEYQGNRVVVVQRADTIRAHGEGAQQQHHVILDATGTGNAVYYISPQNGHILRLNTGQDLDLVISASGKIHHFKQSTKQDFSFSR